MYKKAGKFVARYSLFQLSEARDDNSDSKVSFQLIFLARSPLNKLSTFWKTVPSKKGVCWKIPSYRENAYSYDFWASHNQQNYLLFL